MAEKITKKQQWIIALLIIINFWLIAFLVFVYLRAKEQDKAEEQAEKRLKELQKRHPWARSKGGAKKRRKRRKPKKKKNVFTKKDRKKIEKFIAKCIGDLTKDENRKQRARRGIEKMGAVAIPYLKKSLPKVNDETKYCIIGILGDIAKDYRKKEVALFLISYLDHPKKDIVSCSIRAIRKIKNEKTIKALKKFVRNTKNGKLNRRLCLFTLSKFDQKSLIPFYIELLKDKDLQKESHSILKEKTEKDMKMNYDVWKKWWDKISSE